MKLNTYYAEPVSAWAILNGNITDVVTPVFSRISDTVVQVTKSGHLAANGMFVAFDGLTGTQAYLNGVWPVSNTVAGTSFQFTISGATVPTGTLTSTTVRLCQLSKSFNVAKVGKLIGGVYLIYFSNAMDDTDYAVIANAMLSNVPAGSCSILETTTYCKIQTTDTATKSGVDVERLSVSIFGGIN